MEKRRKYGTREVNFIMRTVYASMEWNLQIIDRKSPPLLLSE